MEELTTLSALVSHASRDEAARWFDLVIEVTQHAPDGGKMWTYFREEWPSAATAASFTSKQAEAFLDGVESMEGDPAQLLGLVGRYRDELVAAAVPMATPSVDSPGAPAEGEAEWEEAKPADDGGPTPATQPPEEGRFAWVYDAGLVDRLALVLSYQPQDYDSHLGPYLERTWGPGWEEHPAGHRQAWLSQLLEDFLQQRAGATDGQAREWAAEPVAQPSAEDLEVARELVTEALAEALAELPEAAELPDDVIQQVLAEALADVAAGGQ